MEMNKATEQLWDTVWSIIAFREESLTKQEVEKYKEEGADLNSEDNKKRNVFMLAATFGDTKTALALAEAGVEINKKDKEGRTACIAAMRLGHSETAIALARIGVDITQKDNRGRTVFDYIPAHKRGHKPDPVRDEAVRNALIAASAEFKKSHPKTAETSANGVQGKNGLDEKTQIANLINKGMDPH